MAAHEAGVVHFESSIDARQEAAKQREVALARMVMTYIGTGLAFMLLPGTFLGVWNLLSISSKHAADTVSASWIQAHGHAQVFGWIGTFILGIGFYSIPKMRHAKAFGMWEAWVCWAMWTTGVTLRFIATVYECHWRIVLPVSAALELLAFALFFKTVSSHRPASMSETRPKLDRWILVVVAGTIGLLGTLIANLVGTIQMALHATTPALEQGFDQRFLVLMAWGFMVPFVWGFSARWLAIFVGLRAACERGLMVLIAVNSAGVLMALFGNFRIAALLLLAGSIASLLALRIIFPSAQEAKIHGVHSSFPYFVRLSYLWLVVAGALGVWAAFSAHPDGIWGASRHALTVGFVSTMVFAIGQRVLPAFGGMRILYSPRLMGLALATLTVGCTLRVSCEVLAYQEILHSAWRVLPISAVTELTAVTLFAINLILTFLTKPAPRLVAIK